MLLTQPPFRLTGDCRKLSLKWLFHLRLAAAEAWSICFCVNLLRGKRKIVRAPKPKISHKPLLITVKSSASVVSSSGSVTSKTISKYPTVTDEQRLGHHWLNNCRTFRADVVFSRSMSATACALSAGFRFFSTACDASFFSAWCFACSLRRFSNRSIC